MFNDQNINEVYEKHSKALEKSTEYLDKISSDIKKLEEVLQMPVLSWVLIPIDPQPLIEWKVKERCEVEKSLPNFFESCVNVLKKIMSENENN